MKRLVIFASGSGSNAENIIRFFSNSHVAIVNKVYCNTRGAYVFERCKQLQVPCKLIAKTDLLNAKPLINQLKNEADYIVLAGFLLKIPSTIIASFQHKIINIHPALLPKYGGKGMFGMHVHKAVKENKETETGISIHFVNENYDEGAIIFQAKIALKPSDTPEDIAQKIHALEYKYFPKIIEKVLLDNG